MYFLSDEWFKWVQSNYSMLISYVQWILGTPIGAYVAMKILAIANRNVPSNKIVDLLQNSFGKAPLENK